MELTRRATGLMGGAAAAAAVASMPFVGVGPAYADTFRSLNCANTQIYNVSICIDRSDQNYNILQGRFVNGSDVGINNDGFFQYSDTSTAYDCHYAVTGAHSTSSCVASFPGGYSVKVCDYYAYNGGYPLRCTTFQQS